MSNNHINQNNINGIEMLDKQKGDFIFECDGCGEVLKTDTSDFNSAINISRRNGWRAKKLDGMDWLHYCEECKK